jgi:hypothetical protein
MKKYVAHYAETGESESFDTIKEAEDWLREKDEEELSEETIDGKNYIAEVKFISNCPLIDSKENYPEGEWPYSDEFDTVHEIKYIPIEELKDE